MASKTTKTAATKPVEAVEPQNQAPGAESEVKRTYLRSLDDHLTVTPIRTRLDQDVKDGLRRVLAARHAAVEAFVEEKLAEYTIEELMEFSAIQIQLFRRSSKEMSRKKSNGRSRSSVLTTDLFTFIFTNGLRHSADGHTISLEPFALGRHRNE
ncbi:hypothetical protein [Ensifer aridi]|uniref:hypothetical protein n=1 Tax=Ensifer aridi TaxID=1708715 RepID=UPI00047D21CB|nr:hypothetical protein [Ensifer aridi]